MMGCVHVTRKRGRNWFLLNNRSPDEVRAAKLGSTPQQTEGKGQTNSLKANFVGCRVIDEKVVFALLKVQEYRKYLFPDEFLQTERTWVRENPSTAHCLCAGSEYQVGFRKYSLVVAIRSCGQIRRGGCRWMAP